MKLWSFLRGTTAPETRDTDGLSLEDIGKQLLKYQGQYLSLIHI